MTTMVIIRHGQASFGESDYDKLSETGIEQSRILGRYLNATGTVFQKVVSGTMKRQTDTAERALEAMAAGGQSLCPELDPAFNEYDYKSIIEALLPGLLADEPEMHGVLPHIFTDNRQFQTMFGRIMDRWVSGHYPTPGVEDFTAYVRRVTRGLDRLAETADDRLPVAVFTSGGVISVAMQLALGLSDPEAMRLAWWVKNTSVTTIRHAKGRFNLLNFNVLSHLELENRPELLTFR